MCASQQGKATDARAPSDIDRVSSRRRRSTPQRQDQRLTWTRMIALTHTHTQRELLITTLIKWAAVAAPAKRVIMAGISFIGACFGRYAFRLHISKASLGAKVTRTPFFLFLRVQLCGGHGPHPGHTRRDPDRSRLECVVFTSSSLHLARVRWYAGRKLERRRW